MELNVKTSHKIQKTEMLQSKESKLLFKKKGPPLNFLFFVADLVPRDFKKPPTESSKQNYSMIATAVTQYILEI